MRNATACAQCRVKKQKCKRRPEAGPCVQCWRKGRTCSLERGRPPSSPRSNISKATDVPAIEAFYAPLDPTGLMSDEIAVQAVQTYLTLIHDRPHSLFHIPTLWHQIRSRTIQPVLLLSVCAFGARLSPDHDVRLMSAQLKVEMKRALQTEMETLSLQTIQACVILANICAADLEPRLETLYFGDFITSALEHRSEC